MQPEAAQLKTGLVAYFEKRPASGCRSLVGYRTVEHSKFSSEQFFDSIVLKSGNR
jgi:hypothetical protein